MATNLKWYWTEQGQRFAKKVDKNWNGDVVISKCTCCGCTNTAVGVQARRERHLRMSAEKGWKLKHRVCFDKQGFVFGLPWTRKS